MGPAGAAGAGRCGVRSAKTRAPGQAREFRDSEEAEERRAGAVGAEAGPLGSRRASSTSRSAHGRDDCSSVALLPLQPQLQPKTKTLPTCQQRLSSLGRAARALERRGEKAEEEEERAAAAAAARDPPPPLPGAATTVSPGAAGARWRRRRRRESALASQTRKPTARRGREVPVSVCICVWEELRGGCECARARRPVRGKQGICPQSPDPYNPSAGTQPSPAHYALELSAWSSSPLSLVASAPVACAGTHVLPDRPTPFPCHSLSP